ARPGPRSPRARCPTAPLPGWSRRGGRDPRPAPSRPARSRRAPSRHGRCGVSGARRHEARDGPLSPPRPPAVARRAGAVVLLLLLLLLRWRRRLLFWLEGALAFQQRASLGLPKPSVPSGGADAADAPCRRPPGHRFRVDAEQRGDLARRKQTISSVHGPLLASTEGSELVAAPVDRPPEPPIGT